MLRKNTLFVYLLIFSILVQGCASTKRLTHAEESAVNERMNELEAVLKDQRYSSLREDFEAKYGKGQFAQEVIAMGAYAYKESNGLDLDVAKAVTTTVKWGAKVVPFSLKHYGILCANENICPSESVFSKRESFIIKCQNKNPSACYQLGNTAEAEQDYWLAKAFFKQGCEYGSKESCKLFENYRNQEGSGLAPKDLKWKAANACDERDEEMCKFWLRIDGDFTGQLVSFNERFCPQYTKACEAVAENSLKNDNLKNASKFFGLACLAGAKTACIKKKSTDREYLKEIAIQKKKEAEERTANLAAERERKKLEAKESRFKKLQDDCDYGRGVNPGKSCWDVALHMTKSGDNEATSYAKKSCEFGYEPSCRMIYAAALKMGDTESEFFAASALCQSKTSWCDLANQAANKKQHNETMKQLNILEERRAELQRQQEQYETEVRHQKAMDNVINTFKQSLDSYRVPTPPVRKTTNCHAVTRTVDRGFGDYQQVTEMQCD